MLCDTFTDLAVTWLIIALICVAAVWQVDARPGSS